MHVLLKIRNALAYLNWLIYVHWRNDFDLNVKKSKIGNLLLHIGLFALGISLVAEVETICLIGNKLLSKEIV